MTDEQLDEFFRDAAGQYTPPSAPEGAWESFLEKKRRDLQDRGIDNEFVDEDKAKKKGVWLKNRRTWQLAAAAILIFCLGGVGIWYTMRKEKPVRTVNDNTAITGNIGNGGSIIGGEDSLKKMTMTTGQHKKASMTKIPPSAQPIIEIEWKRIQIAGIQKELRETGIKDIPLNVLPYLADSTLNRHPDNVPATLRKSDFLAAGEPSATMEDNPVSSIFQYRGDRSEDNNNGGDRVKHGKWQLGLLIGPNLTIVDGDVGKTAGVNTGLVVQRRINDSKFSVGSGVVLESMSYNMAPEDFHPGGRNLDIPSLTSVDGKCQMLEVPVNVRYDVVRTRKNNAFVSTGVSGLLMAKESYSYNYNNQGQTSKRSIEVTGKGKSLYTVTNLSIGYERTFKRTSIQIEPYIKLPMSNIGYGNLNLGSLGTQISIKQNF